MSLHLKHTIEDLHKPFLQPSAGYMTIQGLGNVIFPMIFQSVLVLWLLRWIGSVWPSQFLESL